METEEVKKEFQEDQRSHVNESEGEQLESLCTMNAGVQKQNLAPTDDEMENQQQKDDISKLKEKIESTYYHVTQKENNKRPRLQKLHMLKIKETVKNAKEATAGILKDKDLNLAEINHFIYAAATVITEEVNGAGCYSSETHSSKTPPWVRYI